MAARASEYLFLSLLSFIACSAGTSTNEQVFKSSRRELLSSFQYKAVQHDLLNQPSANYPTTPITNPATTPSFVPPDNSVPSVVTVPATNPVATTPNPVATPATTITPPTPLPVPNTNPVPPAVPVTTPSTNMGTQPVTNPVTTPTPSGVPVTNPTPATTNVPAVPGQTWCVAKSGLQDTALQAALDYACGMGGADCSTIQQGGICYNPNSLQNHASYAFNSYYQKNPTQTSCDFGGTAMITNANPSSGSCVYPLLSSSSSTPATPSTPTTASSTGVPVPGSSTGAGVGTGTNTTPTVLNASTPIPGGGTTGFADSPPTTTTTSSISNKFQYVGCITMVTSMLTGIIITF